MGIACADSKHDLSTICRKGNVLYEKGDYNRAILEYEKVLDAGKESGELYYNIADTYMKLNNVGKAILYYEKAKRLIPRDADLAANLNYAKSLIKEIKLNYNPEGYNSIINKFINKFTINELAVFFTLNLFLLFALIIIKLLLQSRNRYIIGIVFILSFSLLLVVLGIFFQYKANGREMIVLEDKVEVKFAPLDEATTHYTVYEGMKLFKLNGKGKWIKVKRIDGMAGWLQEEDIAII